MEDRLRQWLETRVGVEARTVVRIEEGWDSAVFEVDGEWIVRVPRRQEVRDWVRAEAALLPELARVLPVSVPAFAAVEDTAQGFFVAYRKLDGEPLAPEAWRGVEGTALAAQLGRFLAALHRLPRERAIRAGLADAGPTGWAAQQSAFLARCSAEVTPLLNAAERERAEEFFEDLLASLDGLAETVLIHGDLGPAHLLHRGSKLTGVIDWSDARLGDPALDFAWLLNATGDPFAQELLEAYGSSEDALRARALSYHRLGPWHEVLYGLEHDRDDLVSSGLAGVRRRLPA